MKDRTARLASSGDPSRRIKHIYIEEQCLESEYAKNIIRVSGLPYTVVPGGNAPGIAGVDYSGNLSEGKQILLLCANKGEFLKHCPATRFYNCCDYQIINIGAGCPMDCVYCILQAYLNSPCLSVFVNVESLFQELTARLTDESNRHIRYGTGEFTDSLALDRLTGLSVRLVEHFAGQDRGVLELKTKSTVIDNLEGLDSNGRTVVAWSLNSEEVIQKEEFRTASLEQRLEAAKRCVSWGYDVAFHFDPIIAHPGWQKGYRKTVDALFAAVPPEAIRWISLGAFRYVPKLRKIGTSRFPGSTIFFHEFVEGLDNKQRYFREQRVELYKALYRLLRSYCLPHTCIYFCMESDEVWQEVMGFTPAQRGGLKHMLDEAALGMSWRRRGSRL